MPILPHHWCQCLRFACFSRLGVAFVAVSCDVSMPSLLCFCSLALRSSPRAARLVLFFFFFFKHDSPSDLDVKVRYNQGRHGVEIMIESPSRVRTVSWVRIVNGINKYVTETSEDIPVASVENRGTGKPVAKAKPRPEPTLTLSPCVYSLS